MKDPARINLHVALAFPDTYEVGMSYLGQKILYAIGNSHENWWVERVMAPEAQAAAIMRAKGAPLATLESGTPLKDLAAVGFSITHELCFTDVLHMLDLAGIPSRSKDRGDSLFDVPLIMAGGGAMPGAEPLTPFLDLVALGDGEELFAEILSLLEQARGDGLTRQEFLEKARHIPGVYIPAFFDMKPDGSLVPRYPDYRPRRRIIADLDKASYPTTQVAPVGAIHNRLTLEIARGCSRGCRFCHAGMTYRPVRERSLETLDSLLNEGLNKTGFEEVSFLSLSAGDYSGLKNLCDNAFTRCSKDQVAISLPSLRVGTVDDAIMARMAALRRTGCTLAPEAGSQRLRDVINKGVTEPELMAHCRKLLEHGWRQIKLYFMLGLPTETDADLEAIADLCVRVRDVGGPNAPKLRVTASVSPFVPKPFTPFQWEAQIGLAEIGRRINYLRDLFKSRKNLILHWHDPESSHLEGILSRADRRMADVVELAYRKGAIFCGWAEHFDLAPWKEALAECGVDVEAAIGARDLNASLPWEHIEAGVSRQFLLRERQRAHEGLVTRDCRNGPCQQCGACDTNMAPSLLARSASGQKHGHRLVFDQSDHGTVSSNETPDIGRATQSRPALNPSLTVKAGQYRLWHLKTGNFAFLSQLELQAVLARACRRAGVPVAFSQGFHPLPLFSFGRALPVGMESEIEWFSLTLSSLMAPLKLKARLNRYLPPQLAVGLVEVVDKKTRTEQAIAETFRLVLDDPAHLENVADLFARLMEQEEFIYSHESKKGVRHIDIRQNLLSWRQESGSIIFSANWLDNYISPLLLANAIIAPAGLDTALATRLVKIRQTFSTGKEYDSLKSRNIDNFSHP